MRMAMIRQDSVNISRRRLLICAAVSPLLAAPGLSAAAGARAVAWRRSTYMRGAGAKKIFDFDPLDLYGPGKRVGELAGMNVTLEPVAGAVDAGFSCVYWSSVADAADSGITVSFWTQTRGGGKTPVFLIGSFDRSCGRDAQPINLNTRFSPPSAQDDASYVEESIRGCLEFSWIDQSTPCSGSATS
jgi:hypothetical protein